MHFKKNIRPTFSVVWCFNPLNRPNAGQEVRAVQQKTRYVVIINPNVTSPRTGQSYDHNYINRILLRPRGEWQNRQNVLWATNREYTFMRIALSVGELITTNRHRDDLTSYIRRRG